MFFKSNTQAINDAVQGQVIHIVAKDLNGGIGRDNLLPWEYSEDLKHFAQLTQGKSNIYMGYNTYLSLLEYSQHREELLLGRIVNVLITKPLPPNHKVKSGVVFCNHTTLNRVIKNDKTPVIIIGGSSLYKAYPPTIVFTTEIQSSFDCDTFYYPDLSSFSKIEIKKSENHPNLLKYYMYFKSQTIK